MDVEKGTAEALALARACHDAAEIRESLESAGDTSPLDRLAAALRQGADVREPLWELHEAIRRSGDALGLPPLGLRARGGYGVAPAGLGEARPVEVVFLCPNRVCTRVWRPRPDSTPEGTPRCQLLDQPMRWERL